MGKRRTDDPDLTDTTPATGNVGDRERDDGFESRPGEAAILRSREMQPAGKPDPAGSGAPDSDSPLPPRYFSLGLLGKGGMSYVLRSLDRELGREVAVKVLDTGLRVDSHMRERFVREARTVANLCHPSIVQVHDVDAERGLIVMELLPGGSVARLLKEHGALGVDRALELIRPVLGALAEAHDADVVHRDVKPSNILLDETGASKLCDFGVARTYDSDLTQDGTQPGTPAYMAPEQFRGRAIDHRADLYAAGATLYEMLSGRKLHKEAPDVRRDIVAALGKIGVGPAIASAVARAIAEEPEDRFADAREFLTALEGRGMTDPLWRRRWRDGVALGGLIGLSLAVALWQLSGTSGDPSTGSPVAASLLEPVVAFLPFENRTGDATFDFVAHGLPRVLGGRLAEGTSTPVVTYDALRDVLGAGDHPHASWVLAAHGRSAGFAVEGEVGAGIGETVTLSTRILAVSEDGSAHIAGEITVSGRAAKLDALIGEIAVELTTQLFLGAPPRGDTDRPMRSLEVLRMLQVGVDAAQRADWSTAVENLEGAIAVEPELPEAWYHLAIARSWWGQTNEAPRFEALDHALATAAGRRERTILQALRLIAEHRPGDGAKLLEPLRSEYPRDRDVLYVLGETYLHGGNVREGVAAFRAALDVAPAYLPSITHPLRVYHATRDLEGASYCLSLLRKYGQDKVADDEEVLMLFARGLYDEALEKATVTKRKGWRTAFVRVAIHLVRGEDAAARTLLTGEMADLRHATVYWNAQTVLAAMAYRTGDRAAAARWAEEAARHASEGSAPYIRGTSRATLGIVRAVAGAERGVEADLSAVDAEKYPPRIPRMVLVFRAIAGRLLDRASLLEGALAAPDRDVRMLAEGLLEEMRGEHTAAVATLASALDEPTEGYYDLVILHALARNRLALGDRAGVAVACGKIERPAAYHPYREPALGDCRRMAK